MSYQVLARKWRPPHLTPWSARSTSSRRCATRWTVTVCTMPTCSPVPEGVGKTTIARILARCLNCEQGVTATPCGVCSSCVEISEGRSVDLIEVDAASRTKVEDTRELLDNVQYAPDAFALQGVPHRRGAHALRTLVQRAVKTLEEPPEHVKFLLATTDPQKLPATVLSRCLQFNLKNCRPSASPDIYGTCSSEEQIEFDERRCGCSAAPRPGACAMP
jgi:DNA polymerase-3 subunit gamma/tau